jgi:ADP-ribose pyrophosphatase YjhB (NUDIX family)
VDTALNQFLTQGAAAYLPHISLDCVIFGFHEQRLKVLLLKMRHKALWALPGGFLKHTETLEAAATRILQERTGLREIFLQQFHIFSSLERSDAATAVSDYARVGIHLSQDSWMAQRFLTVGYYALVAFPSVIPQADAVSEACTWWDLSAVGPLMMDHNEILQRALMTLRTQLSYQPIGRTLLPARFTMPELQKLYEAILGKPLDRRNFQRRMLSVGILTRLPERKAGGAHKAPYLYEFDPVRYEQALTEGLYGGW